MRLIARGTGDVGVLLCTPGTPDAAYLRRAEAAVPECSLWLETDPHALPSLRAMSAARTVLVGYSMGGQVVRAMWRNGARPDAVVVIDGTHTPLGGGPWLDVWRDVAESGKRGERLVVLTHTQNTYVETLKPGAYASTWTTLRKATGLPLNVVPGISQRDRLWVISFASAACDKAAHAQQMTSVLPDVLSGMVARDLGLGDPLRPDSQPPTQPAPVPPWQSPSIPYGQRCVLWSMHELDAGVREEPPGSNAGPRIAEYFAACRPRHGDARITSGNWCAAAASMAAREAALPGDVVMPGRYAGIDLETDAKERGVWVPIADVRAGRYVSRIGDVVTMLRGAESWMRHVCRVQSIGADDAWTSIDGNHGVAWGLVPRKWTDPIVGVIRIGG